jgi:hypothetical protein
MIRLLYMLNIEVNGNHIFSEIRDLDEVMPFLK